MNLKPWTTKNIFISMTYRDHFMGGVMDTKWHYKPTFFVNDPRAVI